MQSEKIKMIKDRKEKNELHIILKFIIIYLNIFLLNIILLH